jgi:hypothetical protein
MIAFAVIDQKVSRALQIRHKECVPSRNRSGDRISSGDQDRSAGVC